jgi:anti-sigma regulatory factor (Ser/Thr protein kinase)
MQDIYKQRSDWKIILAIVGAIILIITLIYSNYLAKKLEENEHKNANLFKDAYVYLNDITKNNSDADMSTQDYIVQNFALPVIMKGDNGELTAFNFSDTLTEKQLQEKIKKFLASGQKPIKGTGYASELYPFNSSLLDYIKWYPLIQLFLVGSFIGLGYFLFNSSKKAEQNRVWAGMAKETAHQLGTPISAIMGWVSYLKENHQNDASIADVTIELEKDVERLNLVADRFSKIGSSPELTPANLNTTIADVVEYMKRRASRATMFEINYKEQISSNINNHLFEWVVENMMRNSLDAMDGKGKITIDLYKEEGNVYIDLTDTGKGIPTSKFKTVFHPGYSTKQRGWGLGLSLAKRIIEEYHNGKIYVKASKLDEGTTITIKLKENIA